MIVRNAKMLWMSLLNGQKLVADRCIIYESMQSCLLFQYLVPTPLPNFIHILKSMESLVLGYWLKLLIEWIINLFSKQHAPTFDEPPISRRNCHLLYSFYRICSLCKVFSQFLLFPSLNYSYCSSRVMHLKCKQK